MKKSFTADNGKAFAAHLELNEATGMKVYFCEPYSPWQRGTNETTNGLLWQFFPKGTSFAHISDEYLQHIFELINNRPCKRLKFLTPFEVIIFSHNSVALGLTIYHIKLFKTYLVRLP